MPVTLPDRDIFRATVRELNSEFGLGEDDDWPGRRKSAGVNAVCFQIVLSRCGVHSGINAEVQTDSADCFSDPIIYC